MGTGKKNRISRRRIIVDIIAVIFCTSGAVFAFLVFWRDLNATLTKQNETPVAVISFKQRTAQRRFSDRVVWDILRQDSPVYSGDVIHTADLAEATIFFSNSEVSVVMSENSLAQIFETDSGTRIELSRGALSVDSGDKGTKLVLVSSGVEIDIDGESIVSASAAGTGGGEAAGVQVLKGSANIITADGRVEAGEGSAMALSAEGRAIVSPSVSLLTPLPSSHYLTNGDEAVIHFSWNTSDFGPDDYTRFQIASDQRFSLINESVDIRNSTSQTFSLKPGTYWWRAFAVNPSNAAETPELAFPSKFSIISAKRPELVSPASGSVITYRASTPFIRFQWKPDDNPEIRQYMLQIANDPRLRNPVLSTLVTGNSFPFDSPGEGVWYWQVTPVYNENWHGAATVSASSVVNSFTVRKIEAAISAPTLTLPEDAAIVNIGPSAPPLLFSWKNESDVLNYTIEIADNLDFRSPLFTKTVTENSYSLYSQPDRMKAGVYFWRVSCAGAENEISPPSGTRYFNAVEIPVTFESVFPPDNYSVTDANFANIRFRWNSSVETPSRFQLSRDSAFTSNVIDQTVTEDTFQAGRGYAVITPGLYFWRVTNSYGGMSMETAARRVTVLAAGRVTLESPPPDAEIDGLSALRGQTELRWSSAEPPASSRLIVSRAGATVFDVWNPGRSVTLPPLSEGVYTWTLQAETASGFDISPLVPSTFRVAAIPRLRAPVILRPAAEQSFGPQELRNNRSIRFAWNPVAGANAYIFRLYRGSDSSRANPVVSTAPRQDTSYTVSDFTLLDVGLMIWRIEAVLVSPSGVIEQRGLVAESRFFINISLPPAIELRDEESYGAALDNS
jgi:hypothetical protein